MQTTFFFFVYTGLLIRDMQYTEMLYHFMVEEAFDRSGQTIENLISLTHSYASEHQVGVIKYVKLTVASLTMMVLGFMPSSV